MYSLKQYDAAENFIAGVDSNILDPHDKLRVGAYDLYENIYNNSVKNLSISLRGDDQNPILMPSGRKIVETTCRFLGVNPAYLVEAQGDEGTQMQIDEWWKDFWKREKVVQKINSNKRWGVIRGDAIFYVYAKPEKQAGKRICMVELDPRNVFEIEEASEPGEIDGVHIIELVQDFREPDKPDKKIVRRRTFRKVFNADGSTAAITSELTHWSVGKWDDRSVTAREKQEQVPWAEKDEPPFELPQPITQLPVYKWKSRPPQNSTWGVSILAGMETILYGINQGISDEDATLVFQGLGMYVTTAAPPVDDNGNITDWNIGPKQIIEIGTDQTFERVTGVSDVTASQAHITMLDEKGISEAGGIPEVAIGRVDVAVAESGISLQLQLAPLIASNGEIEIEMINTLDQMFFDITTMWLPAYEEEMFGNIEVMAEMSVVCVFDDPMPANRDSEIQETILLQTSNLILTSMAVAKLRELGWKYPTVDAQGNALTDDDIAAMLQQQVTQNAQAMDPYGLGGLGGDQSGQVDAGGNPVDINGQPIAGAPNQQQITL